MKLNTQTLVLISFVFVAIMIRLFQVFPNFSPVTAVALFAGVNFTDKRLAILVPMIIMLITDIFLGFHTISFFVYGSLVLIVLIGAYSRNINLSNIFASSLIFFILTNFGCFLLYYPSTLSGLLSCYSLAIPFYKYSIIGDLFYSSILYCSFYYVDNKYFKNV